MGDGGGIGGELVISEEDTGKCMLETLRDWFVRGDKGWSGDAAGNMTVDECIDYQLD